MDFAVFDRRGAVRKRATNKAVKSFRINKAQKAEPITPIESIRRAWKEQSR
jgi:hypothetical protein